ncbi:uncharacterized protein [Triticum aestivum]|uniref:uncharacterized protein n=1 Tax=Triticum aestivum TaxID=4565 RepID=UPI001D007F42|nr:uncharacterized protein LOC123101660 [Triticum aestivum]
MCLVTRSLRPQLRKHNEIGCPISSRPCLLAPIAAALPKIKPTRLAAHGPPPSSSGSGAGCTELDLRRWDVVVPLLHRAAAAARDAVGSAFVDGCGVPFLPRPSAAARDAAGSAFVVGGGVPFLPRPSAAAQDTTGGQGRGAGCGAWLHGGGRVREGDAFRTAIVMLLDTSSSFLPLDMPSTIPCPQPAGQRKELDLICARSIICKKNHLRRKARKTPFSKVH